ncbi:MAG: LEA type 2 family protein [Bacteroidia bacterium]
MKLKFFFICVSIFFMSCKEFKEITVTNVDSFYMNKITTEKIEAEVNVKINNPNNTGFSIYPSEFEVIFSGIRLGKAKLDKRVHIDGKAEKVYTFKLNSKIADMNPLDALRLLNLDNLGKIEVKGELKAGKFFLKKKFPVNYTDKVKLFK